ncbi:hypothetical protein P7H60_06385 [Vagococcus carniphilus]|uniref:hypothetical protein n=1 Tax=Vagococcus carniphilus TaxID=218144 RepID=UPI00288E3FFC|nr:hypothetical protein [Vagococcus carniphilus]MDT2848784.1 hypothetical protein [Vagococcus carniphilus]
MTGYKNWKTNQEDRRVLQTAIYEVVAEDPLMTFYSVSQEFGIGATTAQRLLTEYCLALNIENPKRRGFKGKPVEVGSVGQIATVIKNKAKEVNTESTINGKKCQVIKEYTNTMVVMFEGEDEKILVVKKTHEEIRKKNKYSRTNSQQRSHYANY